MPRLRHGVPGEGLSPACDRDAVRPGRGPIASVSLRRMRHDRDQRDMAAARPLDPGAGPDARAALCPDDLSDSCGGAGQMFPVDSGAAHETLRRHTFKVAEHLSMPAAAEPATPSEAIVVTLDSTFIRSCEAGERHLEVRIGNVETATGRMQVFSAVAKTDTDLAALIRRSLNTVGRTDAT